MAEIGKLTEQLAISPKVEHRRAAASELRDVGFARRRSLEKRGTIGDSAQSDLAENELEALHAALEDDDPAVHRAAIIALGDLGDASSVPALLKDLGADDQEIRLAAIDALGDIGGIEGVDALAHLARDNDEFGDVRLAALTQLEELAAKGITSGPDRRFDPPEDPAAAVRGLDEPEESKETKAGLALACVAIEADTDAGTSCDSRPRTCARISRADSSSHPARRGAGCRSSTRTAPTFDLDTSGSTSTSGRADGEMDPSPTSSEDAPAMETRSVRQPCGPLDLPASARTQKGTSATATELTAWMVVR